MNEPLVTVARWSSSPMISTEAGSSPISSCASRQGGVDRRLAGLDPAAGKADLALVGAQPPGAPGEHDVGSGAADPSGAGS